MTLHTVFYDWVESFIERRDELEEAAGRIFGNSRKIVLRNTLAAFRASADRSLEAKEKIKRATQWLYRSVLVKTLLSWHLDARETAGQKRKVEEKRKQVMYRFSNRCVTMTFLMWSSATVRRKQVAALAAAAHKTLVFAIKKGAFLRLRENVVEQALERTNAVTGAIAWSVATPGKIGMWPILLRQAKSRSAAAAHGLDLTQEAADSLAAFGRDNFNNALLQGLTMGACIAKGAAASPSQHRRRPQELSPMVPVPRKTRHNMGLRPDSGDDEESERGGWAGYDGDEGSDFRSVTGAALPLHNQAIGASVSILHSAPQSLPPKKLKHSLPVVPLGAAHCSGQYVGSLSIKQRKVGEMQSYLDTWRVLFSE